MTSVRQNGAINFHVWSNIAAGFTVEFIKKGLNDVTLLTDTGISDSYVTNTEPYINGCGWPIGYFIGYTV
ncbi:MAG: hypothetical protein L0Y76_07670 [Ignavibacteria bacterium]|nr:hypothetical protein [Ignavibacteria bacterium]